MARRKCITQSDKGDITLSKSKLKFVDLLDLFFLGDHFFKELAIFVGGR